MRMGTIAALCLVGVLMVEVGCSATKPPTLTPSPLIPYSAGADALVWLEDQCEDPLEDATTYTTIEAVADLFALPLTMAVYVARMVAYLTVGVGLAYYRGESESVVDQINYVLPWPMAGPNPDRMHYPRRHPFAALDAEAYKVKPHPSCLFTENRP